MTNSELQKLIEEYWIWQEDAVEIERIFDIMTDEKKVEIIDDFENIASQIIKHREEIEKEKEILLIKAIENIEKDIEEYSKNIYTKKTKKELSNLKKQK